MPFGRYQKINSATVTMQLVGVATTGTAPNIRTTLAAAVNPSMPTTASALRSVAKTSASSVKTIPLNAAEGLYSFDITAALQEQVNKAGWVNGNDILVCFQADPTSGRIVYFADVSWGTGTPTPTLRVDHTAPTPMTGQATAELGTFSADAAAQVGQGPVTGQLTLELGTFSVVAEAEAFIPTPMFAAAVAELGIFEADAYGGQGDPSGHTLQPVERTQLDSHFIVTEGGEVFGFAANFDTTLGGIRDGVIGSRDDAWLAESGLTSRTPAPLQFTATLLNRDEPQRDGDIIVRNLANVRQLWLADGRVLDVWSVQLRARPAEGVLELSAIPKGAYPRHPLLSGSVYAASPIQGATPELPTYYVDTAGGIAAGLLQRRVTRGMLAFAPLLSERGVLPLASVGRPVEASGDSDPTSITASYQGKHLWLSLRGVLTRLREAQLGPFGAVLVLLLYWTEHRAHLVSVSSAGARHFELEIGEDIELSEPVITAGVRADGVGLGAFVSLGSSPLAAPFFSHRVPSEVEAERAATAYYREIADPNRSWEIVPPDYDLELSRADTRGLEVAPGESVTVDFAVRRVGGYTGPIVFEASAGSDGAGLTTSAALLSQVGDVDTYRVTIAAPADVAEGSYSVRVDVKAQGADNEGSLLAGVRDSFDALLQVAGSPVIAPNPTLVLQASDPTLHRATEFLRDFSAYDNAFSYNGYARPGRQGVSLLATGQGEAAVYSAVLTNTAEPQRMSAQQTLAMILRQVEKTPAGGVVFQLAAEGSNDGVRVLRVTGGFSLSTVLGAATVTSPDVLGWTSGDAELGLRVTPTFVILTNRANMRSIYLPRPAWSDAGVRVCWGAVRTSSGSFTNITRVHLLTASAHPYALSDIALRRNLDKLRDYAPASDGKPEYPDKMIALFKWNNGEKYKNRAAPALGITATATGAVTEPSGGVSTPGNTTAYIDTGKVFSQNTTLTVITSIKDFADAEAYNCAFGVSGAGSAISAVEVSNRYDGKPRLRHQNGGDAGANAEWAQRDLDKTPIKSVMAFALEVSSSNSRSKLTSLETGQIVTSSGTAANGPLGVSIGAIIRASGNPVEGQKTTNLELIICRDAVSAQELSDCKRLMEI